LGLAAKNGNYQFFCQLLDDKVVDIDSNGLGEFGQSTFNDSGLSLSHFAALYGFCSTVRVLIEKYGMDPYT